LPTFRERVEWQIARRSGEMNGPNGNSQRLQLTAELKELWKRRTPDKVA